jgi:hypothetical protein
MSFRTSVGEEREEDERSGLTRVGGDRREEDKARGDRAASGD